MKNKFGVPCSLLKENIRDADVPCTSEVEAMAFRELWDDYVKTRKLLYTYRNERGRTNTFLEEGSTRIQYGYGWPIDKKLPRIRWCRTQLRKLGR